MSQPILQPKIGRPLRRTAALLCAVLAGLGLAGRAAAQVTGPLTTSPPQPTPFHSPVYHSGGAGTPYDLTAANAPFITPLIDPLQNQLQGTPSEIYAGVLTQIPSFLLGDYDPTRPPQGLQGGVPGNANVYYPNHFADGDIYSWSAPFSYVSQSTGTVTVDDTAAVAPNAFTYSSGFVSVTAVGAATPGPVTSPAAGTATNSEYLRLPSGTPGSAVWKLTEATAGNYSLYFHIPNDLPDATGAAEVRDTNVVYTIQVFDANGNVTTTTSATTSQTEANDTQFLAGPFLLAAGGNVTVTLLRSNTVNNNVDYLVADSMTLQASVGDVQSAPTVITRDLYPNDFASITHPLQYWGIYVPPGTTPNGAPTATTSTAQTIANANPDTTSATLNLAGTGTAINNGNILLKTGNTTTAVGQDALTPDPLRLIRQLVFFGRSEPTINRTSTIDDSQTGFVSTGTGTPGADPAANATATNGEYLTYPVTIGLVATTPVATWTIPSPTASNNAPSFVYVHIPARPANGELRSSHVFYSVTVNGTTVNTAISQQTTGAAALVLLPTGPLTPTVGSNIVVTMYSENYDTVASPATTVVVADSVTVTTSTGQGAIYCVDGFNGGVIWRYETPGSANGASAPVFASPTIAKINVMVAPGVYANRLVVIVGDNNGLVYCLDAIGNGDGTSNVDVLQKDANNNPIPNEPVTIGQPAYSAATYGAVATPLVAGTPATTAALTAHVGTTGVYWIYRPDVNQPKNAAGTVKSVDPTTDVPVPAAFATASPTVFVDPTVNTLTPTAANAIVYIGNSNGVLYALNGSGGARNGSSIDDPHNVSQTGFDPAIPSAEPLWWFSLRGVDPNSGTNASSADIESAPSIYVKTTATTPAAYLPTVYIGSAHEMESTSNVGRLYALNGLYGPSGNNGRTPSDPAVANYAAPGSFNYNVGQVPQTSKTDTTDWSFPDANNTNTGTLAGYAHTSSTGAARPALGNITGSPVVFTNPHETANTAHQTRIYIAANSGQEYPATARPDDTTTGRLWAVNLDGTVGTTTNLPNHVWAYPAANDPNDATQDTAAEPIAPIGSFLRGTPAIGFVQFPATTTNGDGTAYNPADAFNTAGIDGQSVPMLYIGTRGVNDSALYAVDIDGDMTTTPTAIDQRTIYREVSPDGSIYQSSPALVANATNNGYVGASGVVTPGNGGGVYVVAGNTLYDYSATPISNPFAGQAYPLIRENRAFVGFGPISSPALAGATTTDLSSAFLTNPAGAAGLTNTSGFSTNTTDWVYVGDSSTGLARGITPNDASYGGIAVGLGSIIPYDPTAPSTQLLDASIQTFLVKEADKNTATSTAAEPIGASAALPVYEWGQTAYVRFSNVAPPNKLLSTGLPDPSLFVHDKRTYPDLTQASTSNPIPFYTSDGTQAETVTFNLSDVDVTSTASTSPLLLDNGSVQPVIITTPPDGFVIDAGNGAFPSSYNPDAVSIVTNLVANNGNLYLGTYSYTIADGTARNNTPGSRRRFLNVKQVVNEWDYTNSAGDGNVNNIANYVAKGTTVIGGDATAENLVSQKTVDPTTGAVTYGFNANSKIAAIDQPTFGILNPLGLRGGGLDLLGHSPTAVPIGDDIGPFRGVPASFPKVSPQEDLKALANGNNYPLTAPPSTSGVGGSPIVLPKANPADPTSDPTGIYAATATAVAVTATGLISHNTSGDNGDKQPPTLVEGNDGSTAANGLLGTTFGGFGLNVFDRSALFNLGQTARLKMGVPTNTPFAPPSSRDGLYWNSNFGGATTFGQANPDNTGHDSVVNYLPWEIPPTPYAIGSNGNGSQDYPDIAPGNIGASANPVPGYPSTSGDLTSNNITLPVGIPMTGSTDPIKNRTVIGDPVTVRISVPHYQPANQQLYQQSINTATQTYTTDGQIAPVTEAGADKIIPADNVFPMGYVTSKRLYIPTGSGSYSAQRPYRDVRIYTGVPIDMRTSIVNPTTDVGRIPAAFGVQTEQYTPAANPPVSPLGLFDPYNPAFQTYFKPLEIHNDGNVNLLNVHLDQKAVTTSPVTLTLKSDAVDPLSAILGYDLPPTGSTYGVTGPRSGTFGVNSVPEEPYLIRSSLDTDLVRTYDRNPGIITGNINNTTVPNTNATYPGATFHKPTTGGSQPSVLTVPDDPETYVPGASLNAALNGVPTVATDPNNNNLPFKAPPYVSLAVPFGTPVGTYSTPGALDPASLKLFEGLDTAAPAAYSLYATPGNVGTIPSYLYPPHYGKAVGGIGTPTVSPTTGEPQDTNNTSEDVYNGAQPVSTLGTQLTGTVVEQRLTDGATYGAVPMIDARPAAGAAPGTSTPDFAPAAFRDSASGNLSVYWTSGRGGSYGISGSNLPFVPDPNPNSTGLGYFFPTDPTKQWWQPFTPTVATGAVNSGLSIALGPTANNYAFDVAVSTTAPYSNTLYSYSVDPKTGALSNGQAITADTSQVKYGVKGVYTNFTNPLWAFWTGSTRGRTALYYNGQPTGGATTSTLLPVPAGLTAVADASPMLMPIPIGTNTQQIEVTYSGTGPDGNVDLYASRYVPDGTTAATASKLDLVPFPAVTENMRFTAATGWYQSRDVAWSRNGALNVFVRDTTGTLTPLIYSTGATPAPLFTKAIYDKASGLLVLTGVKVPLASGAAGTTNTVYVDSATGRIRFSPALRQTDQNFAQVRATFSPLAHRLTLDGRADTGPVTFLDRALKINDAPGLAPVVADRRWTIWRKSGVSGGVSSTASLYFKTQRLTYFLPTAVDPTKTVTVTLNGTGTTNYDLDYARGRIYFPIATGAEGGTVSVQYTAVGAATQTTFPAVADSQNTVQWQDEPLANNNDVPPVDSAAGTDTVLDNGVPIVTAVNENNVAAFLDPFASATSSHKVWLFWNSTRNGTADIYSETIDPRFAPTP